MDESARPEPPPKPLLSVAEVMAWLGVSRGTIKNWIEHEAFPEPLRLGKLAKWRRGDVEEWLDGRPQGFGFQST